MPSESTASSTPATASSTSAGMPRRSARKASNVASKSASVVAKRRMPVSWRGGPETQGDCVGEIVSGASALARAPGGQDDQHRAQQDLQVQSQREVLQVVEVVGDLHLGLFQIAGIAGAHLRPAGDARA